MEPRTKIDMGNMVIISVQPGKEVAAVQSGSYYLLTNGIIAINISAFGNASSWVPINASELINYIENLNTSTRTDGNFTFKIAGVADSDFGNGYTVLQQNGTSLATATVLAHINSTAYEYDLELTLDASADFVKARVAKLTVK
jgi:hypothetical protein